MNIYPAPNRWFETYLRRKKCSCVLRGSSKQWSNGSNKIVIANNCILHKQMCSQQLKNLNLPFEDFEVALEKHKARYKKSVR